MSANIQGLGKIIMG